MARAASQTDERIRSELGALVERKIREMEPVETVEEFEEKFEWALREVYNYVLIQHGAVLSSSFMEWARMMVHSYLDLAPGGRMSFADQPAHPDGTFDPQTRSSLLDKAEKAIKHVCFHDPVWQVETGAPAIASRRI